VSLTPPGALRDRVLRSNPFRLFALVGLLGTLAIGGAGLVASRQSGEAEAMADVREMTQLVARTVVEPSLSSALVAGEQTAIDRLDAVIRERVLDGTTVRVKLWDAEGRIVYSDEPRLIGEHYELDDDQVRSLRSGGIVSEVSSLAGPENRFEADAGRLLEVYLPVAGPDGAPLLYESYFAFSAVSRSTSRILGEFVPIVVASLVLMEALHLSLAWGLNRRMRRGQREREQLLERAIDASDLERRRLAADLHDGVVQELVGTSYAVAAAAERADGYAVDLADDLRTAAVATRRSLQSLRSLLIDIYPPNLRELGLEAALIDLLAPAASLGIETDLTVAGDPDFAPGAVTLAYRVTQEAVRNAVRHAGATMLEIEVEALFDALVVTISDDGCGFSTSAVVPDGHFGLRLLSDLTADAGAGLVVESTPGSGTSIRVEVPT
jgi:signal transduction histidine kinase